MSVNEESPTAEENGEIQDITKDDISKAIAKKLGTSNFEILHYTLEPLKERVGLLGDHSTLYVSVQDPSGATKKLSFFIKYFPKLEPLAKFAEGIGAFKKEIFVYELFEQFRQYGVDIIANVTARCYLTEYNKYLVFDDLASEGFTSVDKHKTLDYDDVLIILQSLAKLHASSLIYEEKKSSELSEDYRLIHDYAENFEESFFSDIVNARGVAASIECIAKEIGIFGFPDKLPSGKSFSDVAKEECRKIYDLVKPSTRFRNVLCHGDLWATNFLLKHDLKYQPLTSCKLVDFQCGRYVPPAQDVLSVLYLTTSRDFRRKHLYQVVGMYYNYLERHLKAAGYDIENVIPFTEFMDSCEEQKLFAIIQTAIHFPLILIGNDAVLPYLTDKDLHEKALFEDKSRLVLAHMDNDESYTARLKESIQDLKDYCDYV